MWWAVDYLASEYGWSFNDILTQVYFDDLIYLTEKANIRRIREWKMQLAITTNPHIKNPKQLFIILEQQESQMLGTAGAEFDGAGFEVLKNQLTRNPRFIVK